MADIHILQGPDTPSGQGHLTVAFHVPTPTSVQAATAATTPPSQVPNLDPAEGAALADGSLHEVIERMPVEVGPDFDAAVAAAQARIRAHWHTVAGQAAKRLQARFKFYGATLARSDI